MADVSLSRRGFLGLGAVGAVAAGLGLAGCGSPSTSGSSANSGAASDATAGNDAAATGASDGNVAGVQFKATNNSEAVSYAPGEISETLDCDICVVGLGMSGLSAAVQAANNGDKVVGLEITNVTGGNGIGVEGVFGVNSKMQKEQGITFTPAEVISTELAEAQMNTNGALWSRMVFASADNIDWLQEQGVQFSGMVDDYMGSGIVSGFHWFEGNVASVGYVPPMTARAEELGVDIRYNTAGRQLIVEDGKVVGIYARTSDGKDIQVNAKAVILATGGYAQNQEYIEERGFNWDNFLYGGTPMHNGDGLVMALKAGASNFVKNSTFNCTNIVGTGSTFQWKADSFVAGITGAGMFGTGGFPIWVNDDGVRFISEDFAKDNFEMQSVPAMTQRNIYAIFDRTILETVLAADPDKLAQVDGLNGAEEGLCQADTLDELAKHFDLPADTFKKTVEDYNAMCANGVDTEFAKPASSMMAVGTPPFYAAKLNQWYLMSVGGIECDINAQVVDDTKKPIEGLYAVGTDGCMLYRNIYTINVGGTCNCNNINSGRTAANHAHQAIA